VERERRGTRGKNDGHAKVDFVRSSENRESWKVKETKGEKKENIVCREARPGRAGGRAGERKTEISQSAKETVQHTERRRRGVAQTRARERKRAFRARVTVRVKIGERGREGTSLRD
jgi:hypothetical protein